MLFDDINNINKIASEYSDLNSVKIQITSKKEINSLILNPLLSKENKKTRKSNYVLKK